MAGQQSGTRAQRRGQLTEQHALRLLENAGLKLLASNYRCRCGEIDLIMRDGPTIVFVEVRFRASAAYGSAAESVDARKQRKIRRSAEHFLISKGISSEQPCRFDIVAFDGELHWYQGAFF